MSEPHDKRAAGIQRYHISSQRTSTIHVIGFEGLGKQEHVVRIADLSIVGTGIVSSKPIEQGLVCFEEPVGGHRFGVTAWCRPEAEGYRAGIKFITLGQDKEQYILRQLRKMSTQKCLRDPEQVIETLMKSIKPESGDEKLCQ